jgi:hypothetical protein
VKTNRFQIFGHTSVDILFQDEGIEKKGALTKNNPQERR